MNADHAAANPISATVLWLKMPCGGTTISSAPRSPRRTETRDPAGGRARRISAYADSAKVATYAASESDASAFGVRRSSAFDSNEPERVERAAVLLAAART